MPINGFEWDEIEISEHDLKMKEALLNLIIFTGDQPPHLIGTAFVIQASGEFAVAITAAHCLEEVRNILYPNKSHHLTALPEFLPPDKEVELKDVFAISMVEDRVYVCPVELSLWDKRQDIAILKILAPKEKQDLFQLFFRLDNTIPEVGELVCMIGYGEMKTLNHPDVSSEQQQYATSRRLVMRVGSVEAVHSDGHFMLKAPCIETSIAIYGGMSGGIVARFIPGEIKPFAFVSHAPDPQPYYDRSQSGHSMGAIMQIQINSIDKDKQDVLVNLNNVQVGRITP